MATIKLISRNVKGISNKTKRYKIITHLKSLDCGVAMLQDTHLKDAESAKLRQRWVGQVYSAPGTGASGGVSILIAKRLSFRLKIVGKDGRYIIMSGLLQNIKCTLVNVYSPNIGQTKFLSRLNVILSQFAADSIFMGGDLNLVSDPVVDRSGHPLPSDGALSAALKELQNSLAVTDIWRAVNPHAHEYTFYSHAHNSYSRIDYWLLSQPTVENVIDCKIHNIIISDLPPCQSCSLFLQITIKVSNGDSTILC